MNRIKCQKCGGTGYYSGRYGMTACDWPCVNGYRPAPAKQNLSYLQKKIIMLMREGFWMDYYACPVKGNNKRINVWHSSDPNYKRSPFVHIPLFKALLSKGLICTSSEQIPYRYELTELGKNINID